MAVAKVEEVKEDVLCESFIAKMRAKAGNALKSAISKVLGIFHASASLVYLDQGLLLVKKTFIRLHESAHGFLPWQRPLYAVVEDCEKTLGSEVADLFDREANVFASEVLFQIDTFTRIAEEHEFSIWTPIKLHEKFGASIYASVRQYVSKNSKACAVLILNMPVMREGDGFTATLRRPIQSIPFIQMFGNVEWPDTFTPDDQIGAMVPIGRRRSSDKRNIVLCNRNGETCECIAEAFTQTYQVFILIHLVKTLTRTSFIMP